MADTFIQVITNEADKAAVAEILAELGTNTSAVVNMLLKITQFNKLIHDWIDNIKGAINNCPLFVHKFLKHQDRSRVRVPTDAP